MSDAAPQHMSSAIPVRVGSRRRALALAWLTSCRVVRRAQRADAEAIAAASLHRCTAPEVQPSSDDNRFWFDIMAAASAGSPRVTTFALPPRDLRGPSAGSWSAPWAIRVARPRSGMRTRARERPADAGAVAAGIAAALPGPGRGRQKARSIGPKRCFRKRGVAKTDLSSTYGRSRWPAWHQAETRSRISSDASTRSANAVAAAIVGARAAVARYTRVPARYEPLKDKNETRNSR